MKLEIEPIYNKLSDFARSHTFGYRDLHIRQQGGAHLEALPIRQHNVTAGHAQTGVELSTTHFNLKKTGMK